MATFNEKFRYRFDNFMAKGGKSIFISLFVVFLAGLILLAGIRLGIYGASESQSDERKMGFFGKVYITFLQMTDPGNMAQDVNSSTGFKIEAILAGAVGVVIFFDADWFNHHCFGSKNGGATQGPFEGD